MDTKKTDSTVPGRAALVFRFIIIFVVSCGVAELAEAWIEKHLSPNELFFELCEHTVLVSLLLVFMNKFVTAPLLKEIALRKQSEQLLEQSEFKNRSIIEALPDSVLQVRADGNVIEYRPKQSNVLNFTAGANVADQLPPDTILNFLNCLNATLQSAEKQQIDLKFMHGSAIHYLVFNFIKTAENEVTVFIRDITNRKTREEQLQYLSSHDALTGLYNRTYYEAELDRLLTGRRYPVSIIIIDLDGLKSTNDTYGHTAGDRMICKAAAILKQAFRVDDLVARTGGDEFTILLPETGDKALNAAVQRIETCLNEANISDDGYVVEFSMGTAVAETKEKLLGAVKVADMKMYQNKATRKLRHPQAM